MSVCFYQVAGLMWRISTTINLHFNLFGFWQKYFWGNIISWSTDIHQFLFFLSLLFIAIYAETLELVLSLYIWLTVFFNSWDIAIDRLCQQNPAIGYNLWLYAKHQLLSNKRKFIQIFMRFIFIYTNAVSYCISVLSREVKNTTPSV